MSPSLLITTSHNLPAVRHERAAQIADRCGAPFVPRRGSLGDLFAGSHVERVYVVSAEREVLHARDGTSIGVDEGMLKTRLHAGRQHPLIRAVAPSPVTCILDATLGLAADALHLAAALGVPVTGTEINPVVFSLLEAGLARAALTGSTRDGATFSEVDGLIEFSGPATVNDGDNPCAAQPARVWFWDSRVTWFRSPL